MITGLEDDDNFFELVRQRAALADRAEAVSLANSVMYYVCRRLDMDQARAVLGALPHAIEEYVFPKLEFPEPDSGDVPSLSLAELEALIEVKYQVELDCAARMAASVGYAVSERVSAEELSRLRSDLPEDLKRVFPERSIAA